MPAQYNRVIISGLLAGVQSWSVTPAFSGNPATGGAVTDYADLLTWAQAIGGLNNGAVLGGNLSVALSSLGNVQKVRTECLSAAGVLQEAAEFALPVAESGSGTPSNPLQISIVSSLQTGRPGRSYNGRIYWPNLGIPIQTNSGRIATQTATQTATDVAALLTQIAEAAPGGSAMHPAVVSHKLAVQTLITEVRVGNVLDTQRRRRDKLVEQYSGVPIGG